MRTHESLESLADEAGAGPDLRRYITARGVKTVPTLALAARNEDELHRFFLDPLFAGFDDGTQTFKVEAHEQPIAKAILTHMWSMAQSSWTRSVAAAAPPPPTHGTETATGTTHCCEHQ